MSNANAPDTNSASTTNAASAPEAFAPPEPPRRVLARRVWGWKEIAKELDVSSVTTAQGYAERNRDPLPIEYGHKGVWAYASALRDWVRRQNVPYRVHLERVRMKAAAKTAPARAAAAARRKQRTA